MTLVEVEVRCYGKSETSPAASRLPHASTCTYFCDVPWPRTLQSCRLPLIPAPKVPGPELFPKRPFLQRLSPHGASFFFQGQSQQAGLPSPGPRCPLSPGGGALTGIPFSHPPVITPSYPVMVTLSGKIFETRPPSLSSTATHNPGRAAWPTSCLSLPVASHPSFIKCFPDSATPPIP